MSKKKKFKRQDNHKKKSIPSSWRKPVGRHSNVRKKKKSALPMPKPGYRGNKETRGLHPSGYEEVLVNRPADLEDLEEHQAARISGKVGGKKRQMIVEKAEELEVKLLNAGDTDE